MNQAIIPRERKKLTRGTKLIWQVPVKKAEAHFMIAIALKIDDQMQQMQQSKIRVATAEMMPIHRDV